jgi:hypothetical protein
MAMNCDYCDLMSNEYYHSYFMAGNVTAMKIHIEKNGVNALSNYYGDESSALVYSRTRQIAHFLLKNGADPNLLVKRTRRRGYYHWGWTDICIARLEVVRWCLEYDISIKNIVTAKALLKQDKYGHLDHKCSDNSWKEAARTELDYVQLLRDFDYEIPEDVLEKHAHDPTTRGAFITYSFIKPLEDEEISPDKLRWNTKTHRFFPKSTKDNVITCLLCFRTFKIPKDIRNLILELAFFEK